MNTKSITKNATKGLMIFGFAALGFFLLATLAKRSTLAATVQNKIATGM